MSDRPLDTIAVAKDEDGLRLDRWFKIHYPDLTYGHLQKLLRSGQIRVASKRAQSNTRLEKGQEIRVPRAVREPAAAAPSLKPPPGLSKADRRFIEDCILYEDEAVLVLNKPFGIAVQGGTGTKRHIDGLLEGMSDRFGGRPRLVHRLVDAEGDEAAAGPGRHLSRMLRRAGTQHRQFLCRLRQGVVGRVDRREKLLIASKGAGLK